MLKHWMKNKMNKPHKHAELIKQWAEGAEIQVRHKENCTLKEWFDASSPTWRSDAEYRVKPIEKWTPEYTLVASEYLGDNPSHSDYNDVSADVRNYWKLIKFVEEFDLDEDNQHYEVFKDYDGSYTAYRRSDYRPSLGVVRMSKQCAEKLCEMLNNGEIEL
jgi:hypothetical protein